LKYGVRIHGPDPATDPQSRRLAPGDRDRVQISS
jgi:hypothetical protein